MDNKERAKHNRLLRRFILIQRRNRCTHMTSNQTGPTHSRPRNIPIIWHQTCLTAPLDTRMNAVERARQAALPTGETIGTSRPPRRRMQTTDTENRPSSRRKFNSVSPSDETMTSPLETETERTNYTSTNTPNRVQATNQTTTEEGGTRPETLRERKYTTPWNFGGPTQFCPDCGARVWLEERVKREKNKNQPKYNICCQKGKVKLPLLKEPPQYLKSLLDPNNGTKSAKFRECIRAYNSIFAFTSMGGHVDRHINRGRGPYVFRIHGQNYHKIGSLLPPDGEQPRFTQLYVHDTANDAFLKLICSMCN